MRRRHTSNSFTNTQKRFTPTRVSRSNIVVTFKDKSSVYCNRGKALMGQGYFIEALFDFSLAIKLETETKEKEEKLTSIVGEKEKYEKE